MKIFVAGLQECGYETEPFNIGVYSSRELAEQAILKSLREEEEVVSLEEYDEDPDALYDWFVEEWELDQ